MEKQFVKELETFFKKVSSKSIKKKENESGPKLLLEKKINRLKG